MIYFDLQSICNLVDSFLIDSCDNSIGINSNNKERLLFKIIPNPNNGQFILEGLNQGDKYSNLEIFNLAGERIYFEQLSTSVKNYEINFIGFPDGYYICKVVSDQRTYCAGFINQK